ncbi:MAG: hypothetical protein IJ480_02020 [Clostridia bacterium]|nr:hypothetical protein [Clostridia bacterium]
MELFQNAKYIWCAGLEDTPNCYVNCYETLHVTPGKTYRLYITAHTDYSLWNDGRLVTFGQFADYPDQVKIYDEVDITDALQPGENKLTITGYGQRVDSSTQRGEVSGILYVITEDGADVCHSSPDTCIAPHPYYISGNMEKVSGQLGFTFQYDATGEVPPCGKAVETAVLPALAPRPIKKLLLKDPCPMRLVTHGCFSEGTPNDTLGRRIQYASLSFGERTIPNWENGLALAKKDTFDGTYAVIDIGREEAGILSLDVEVDEDTELLIGWGEHLDDMRVRSFVGGRNFACRVVAKKGRFTFVNPHRRLGGRYLELHAYGNVKIHRCTILPTDYPTTADVNFRCADHMHNEIYETCKRTLLMCMHEHYEDCPWREQALYTMDSRNQMLCGYYTFRETAFPKASLRLIGQSIRDDSFLELCSPARVAITIPCFCAVYLVQLWEYVLFTGDLEFAREMLPVCEKVCKAFMARTAENGLIPMLQEKEYWNFYEWQSGLDNGIGVVEDNLTYDLPLNAFVSMAYQSMGKILAALGMDGALYNDAAAKMNETCHRAYYNDEAGWYYSKIDCKTGERSHLAQLTQALAVCAGMCPADALDKVLENLAYNTDELEVTLSHSVFRYDALLMQPEKYGRFVFDHIAKQFGHMLKENATTFWETMEAGRDFGFAGSLCHAWSAIPSYLYFRYAAGLYPDAPGHMGEAKPLPVSQTGIYEIETDF